MYDEFFFFFFFIYLFIILQKISRPIKRKMLFFYSGISNDSPIDKFQSLNCRLRDFVCADAGQYMVNIANEGLKADVVIMDPPRAGSDVKFLKSVIRLNPRKVVYISCNPETCARDILFLSKNKYKVRKIQPVDMFPHTEHVETVVLMSKANT